jgi:hypothetical protein
VAIAVAAVGILVGIATLVGFVWQFQDRGRKRRFEEEERAERRRLEALEAEQRAEALKPHIEAFNLTDMRRETVDWPAYAPSPAPGGRRVDERKSSFSPAFSRRVVAVIGLAVIVGLVIAAVWLI